MRKIALIIGVDKYQDPEFKRLNAAVNDAGIIEGVVRECLHFDEVIVERNPAQHTVRNTLNRIKGQLKSGDLLLFYFAGHGFSTAKNQLLVMADAEHDGLTDSIGVIKLSYVEERTRIAGVKRLCILDCCRSFLTQDHQRDVGAEAYLFDSSGVRDLCRIRSKSRLSETETEFTVLNACSHGETAHEPKEQGLFTQALSAVLRKMKEERKTIELGAGSHLLEQLKAALNQLLIEHQINRLQTPCLFPDEPKSAITLYASAQEQHWDWQQEEKAWTQAKAENTPTAYRRFMQSFPQSHYVSVAQASIAQLELTGLQGGRVPSDVPSEQPPEKPPEPKRSSAWLLIPLVVAMGGAYSYWQSTSKVVQAAPEQAVAALVQKAALPVAAAKPEPEPKIEPEPRLELAPEPLPELVPEPEAAPEPAPLSDEETKQLEITALQARITARLQLDQLTKPEGESAYDAILALEALEPTSEFAQTARDSIGLRYAQLIEKTGCNNLTNAMGYLDAGLKVSPASNALAGYQSLAASCAEQAQARERQKAEAAATAVAIAAAAQSQSALANSAAYEPTMVKIPAGRFQMGCVSGKNCSADELPVHSVEVKSFYMSQTEITFAQWDACVAAGACKNKADDETWGRDNRPVINVSWNDIKNEYLPWLNKVRTDKATRGDYRLPTEAQWEYAARAGSEKQYSWGNSINCSQARYGYYSNECGKQEKTDPVAQYAANGFGLYDMHGNVWEWTEDCLHTSYKGAPNNAETAWEGQDGGNCDYRIVRGGSWIIDPETLRSASRYDYPPTFRNNPFGFRIVQPLIP